MLLISVCLRISYANRLVGSNEPALPQQAALRAGLAEDLGGEEQHRVDAAPLPQALVNEPAAC
jgi:hypothetical protein